MLTVLGGLAEFERDLIRARTGEGRARAVARGVKMGRKPKPPRTSSAKRSGGGTVSKSLAEIGRSYNVSGATNSRLAVWMERHGPRRGGEKPEGRYRKQRGYADFFDWPDKPLKEWGIVQGFCEGLERDGGPKLSLKNNIQGDKIMSRTSGYDRRRRNLGSCRSLNSSVRRQSRRRSGARCRSKNGLTAIWWQSLEPCVIHEGPRSRE